MRQRLVATAKGVPCQGKSPKSHEVGGWKRIPHGIRPGDRSSIEVGIDAHLITAMKIYLTVLLTGIWKPCAQSITTR